MNPYDVIKYDRTRKELHEFLLFCMCVAGKNAQQQGEKLRRFIKAMRSMCGVDASQTALEMIIDIGEDEVDRLLRAVKMGKYNLLVPGFMKAARMYTVWDLSTATVLELKQITGIGYKTAKFFILFSRDDEIHAVLDTHILKWMASRGVNDLPSKTPTLYGPYYKAERQFLLEIAKCRGHHYTSLDPRWIAEDDFAIWKHYNRGDELPDHLK